MLPGWGILGCMEPSLTALAPFKLEPFYSPRIWGFDDLAPWFDRKIAPGETPIGEAWLSGPQCLIANGPLQGKTLAQAVKDYPQVIVGECFAAEAEYPLLVKVLFPKEKLSVQVHPDDELAQSKGEPRGKTECWYVLEAKPDAKIALGLNAGVTPEQVRTAIADATMENLLGWVPVAAGDMVYVDAGTVHAIWPGVVILETQQTSDTTYRLYDYGRPRELHVEASLEAMRTETRAGKIARAEGTRGEAVLVAERYFRVERWDGDAAGLSQAALAEGGTQLLFTANGTLRIEGPNFEAFQLGRCELAVIPASAERWEARGAAEVMRMVPQAAAAPALTRELHCTTAELADTQGFSEKDA
jgi:mannose-6-phosphate isomerase